MELIGPRQLAEMLGCSSQTVYNWINSGGLPVEPCETEGGCKWRIDDVLQYLAEKENTESTELYRHFDDEGKLLYVGISINALIRWLQHKANSKHANRVSRITIERFETRNKAIFAEKKAIRDEKPEFNVSHNPGKIHKKKTLKVLSDSEKPLLGLTETAAFLGIPRRTLYRMLQERRFPVEPVAGMQPRKWRRSDLDSWLKSQPGADSEI